MKPPSRFAPDALAERIKEASLTVGFSAAAIAPLEPVAKAAQKLERWLGEGKHGTMAYLEASREPRIDPRRYFPAGKSALCVALNYYLPPDEFTSAYPSAANFSIYARRTDYHLIMQCMLAELAAELESLLPGLRARACVDTSPVSDRTLALRAGLAWQGKNTCLFCPPYGSWVFLGELLLDIELPPGEPKPSCCGSCTLCIEACPTGALNGDYTLDATRCISYLTIEKRGAVDAALRRSMGTWLFGCDECQRVCPYNSDPVPSALFARLPVVPLLGLSVAEIAGAGNKRLRALARGSAAARCRPASLRRNARIVLANLERSRPSR